MHNKVECIQLYGYIDVNCYIYSDHEGHAFVIDPGCSGDVICDYIGKNGIIVDKILLTHGHFDHFGAAEYLREKTGAEIYAYEGSDRYLKDPSYNLSNSFGTNLSLDRFVSLKNGEIVSINDDLNLKVISTPGHTTDSVIYYSEKDSIAFTGDTIFKRSYGNTMFPGGNIEELKKSIKEKVFSLSEETILYSGHTEQTTVREEKQYFKFLNW